MWTGFYCKDGKDNTVFYENIGAFQHYQNLYFNTEGTGGCLVFATEIPRLCHLCRVVVRDVDVTSKDAEKKHEACWHTCGPARRIDEVNAWGAHQGKEAWIVTSSADIAPTTYMQRYVRTGRYFGQ